MSHRNSKPKPGASERTHYRWRMRHSIETREDQQRFDGYEKVKELYKQRNRF